MFNGFVAGLSAPAVWLAFSISLAVILYAGTRLAKYGDLIAVKTGLGGTWIGVILLASVTSLPELITGISSILVVGQPDLAVGGVLGSLVYNLLIIAVLDFVYTRGSIYSEMNQGHSVSAGFGVIMLGTLAGSIFLQRNFTVMSLGHIGPYTIIAPILYMIAMRGVFSYERRERELFGSSGARGIEDISEGSRMLGMGQIYTRYAINAAIVVATALALPVIADALASTMGWRQTFVGTIFLALATSVPEIVISVHAVRIGAVDLAIGNVLGSNLFDLVTLPIDDLVYVDGPLLAAASPEHLFTVIAAITMTGVAGVALCYRPKTKVLQLIGWFSLALLIVALLNALVLFLL